VIPATKHENDPAVTASRAVEPLFYRADVPNGRSSKRYQDAGVEYALGRRNCIIGDQPGVGKSAQGVFISNAEKAKRTLVVCPASLRLNWEREVWLWSTKENVRTYPVMKASDGISADADYTIISYDLLRNHNILDAILDLRWDHVIADEAHALKDPKGNKRTKSFTAPDLLPNVTGRFSLLTGTLLPNQPIECFNAIRMCNWDAIDRASLEDFRQFYYAEGGGMIMGKVFDEEKQACVYKLHWSQKVRNVPRNLDDLQYRLRKHVMVRRLKEQVLHELPPKQWHPFPLEVTAGIRKALNHPGWSTAEKLYDLDPEGFMADIQIDGAVSTARLELGLAKAPSVIEYIEDLLESGVEKVVVGGWHIQVLALMQEKLKKYGLVYMDGRSSDAAKQRAVDAFQQNEGVRIILGQMLPLGEGWTLTRAQDVVLAEPFWVPGKNDQLLDRCHRLGQTQNVIGHIPVVPGTLDERILASVIKKDESIHLALDAQG
jgi:SWI/SNF-related matrix-associated actin-dependent regulator 1 of chromatin subfamily A